MTHFETDPGVSQCVYVFTCQDVPSLMTVSEGGLLRFNGLVGQQTANRKPFGSAHFPGFLGQLHRKTPSGNAADGVREEET